MTRLGNVGVGGKNPVRIMGILNTSPESFYKKSIKTRKQQIISTVKQMEVEGADFIDVGGMSTAPYLSTIIPEKTESKRIIDAIKIMQKVTNLPISVDTCRASVASAALENGIEIINDITGLKYDPKMISVVEKFQPSVILCAFDFKTVKGTIKSTKNLLKESTKIAKSAGIHSDKIVLDPGIGFFRKTGKGPFFTRIRSNWYNRDLSVIQKLRSIKDTYPILISVSNKSIIGKILDTKDPQDRLSGSLAAEVVSVLNGADIIRTHNVRESNDAIKVALKITRHKGL